MNRKLILGIIIVLVVLILAIVALMIAGPKEATFGNNTNTGNLSSDLNNLDSGDASVLDQNIDSTIVDLGE